MLSSFNISFETTGDTEIILYCYLVFGTDIFKELNGIFSFVIYDNDTAIVVRDHIGVKPLFYYHNNREFVFSSEPKDRKSTRLNSSHVRTSRMPSSA